MAKIEFVSFPSVELADDDGLLAMGGDLSINSLVSAYSQGIFPWFDNSQPFLWWSPDPRMVLYPNEVKISRSLTKKIRQQRFQVSCNQVFSQVITNCAFRGQKRDQPTMQTDGADDTWITQSMTDAYIAMHAKGYAHSIEVWDKEELVGGLYGIALGKVFFGESMFSAVSDASKVALATLCAWLRTHNYQLIDCQVSSDHLISLGAKEVRRTDFMQHLTEIDIQQPSNDFGKDISQLDAESVINIV